MVNLYNAYQPNVEIKEKYSALLFSCKEASNHTFATWFFLHIEVEDISYHKYEQEAQGPHCSPESYWLIFCI
jgi:hypothetical protein